MNEARYRQTEKVVFESFGLTPSERSLTLSTGRTVRLLEVGEGPPALFMHGVGASGANWVPLVAQLPGVRCLLLDRPGCGLSQTANDSGRFASIDAFNTSARRLVPDVLDVLELERADVVATSFGTYFALQAAAHAPERIRRLASVGFPFGAVIEKVPLSMRLAAVPGMEALTARMPPTRPAVRLILKQLGLGAALRNGRFTPELLDWFLSLLRDTATLRNEQRAAPRLITALRGQNPAVVLGSKTIDRITTPSLFLWGGRDPLGGEATARPFVSQFPEARLHMLPDASHAPWIDEPEHCADFIRAFIAGGPLPS